MIYQKIPSKYKELMSELPLTNLENLMITYVTKKGLVSLFYSTLVPYEKESSKDRLEAWRTDIWEDTHKADQYNNKIITIKTA